MTTVLLPTINFNANPTYNDWIFQHQIYSTEFYQRLQIGAQSGIVDSSGNPAVSPFSSARPLNVQTNATNPLTLDISPGIAITPNFQMIIVDATVSGVPLPTVVVNTVYVVCIEYTLVPSAQTTVNRFMNVAEVRDERPSATPFGDAASTLSQVMTVDTLANFNNPSLYSQDRKNGLVVLALVVVQAAATTGALTLAIDLTQTTFSYNRPWFSYKDVYHESRLGTGVETDTNPHATSLQDLSTAGFTLFQQLLPKGGVFSKDLTYYGYPGTFCTEVVSLNRYQVDQTGTVTGDANLPPLTGRYFVTLTKVPVRMGSLYYQGMPWQPIPYYWKPGTRYLILAPLEQPLDYTQSLTVEYFSVSALMPPAESLTQGVQSFQVGDPTSGQDYIISAGIALNTLNLDTLNLSAILGPIKKAYQVLCNGDGTLVTAPQNLVPVMRVTDLLNENQITVNQSPINGSAVPFIIGLTGATNNSSTPGYALNLQILINGLDENGAVQEDTIIFNASQWQDQSGTSILQEQPMQFQVTSHSYQLINYVQILNTTSNPDNSGSNALLSFWADILQSPLNQELANVSSFFWDGLGARNVTDTRIIGTTVQTSDQRNYRLPNLLPENDATFVQELFAVLLNPPLTNPAMPTVRLALELDNDRQVSETWDVFSTTPASGVITVNDFTLITEDMTLQIAEDSVLTFVTGTSDPTSGQVLIPSSPVTGSTEILNNIAATVNNATFDSSWFATVGTNTVTLTRAEAFPRGFTEGLRLQIDLSGPFTAGEISFSINGIPISPVTSTGVHDTSIAFVVQAINALTAQTGVSAVQLTGAISYVMMNGDPDGTPFNVTAPTFIGASITGSISSPADPFTLTAPVGGSLPTPHLPNRYISNELKWTYLSVALPWVGVSLQSSISFSGNVATNIQNMDQCQIVPGKIVIARAGNPAPSINRGSGEFLVTPSSLLLTLQSLVDTINDPTFASGCQASLDPTETMVLIDIGGYASAQIVLLLESVSGTWIIGDYAPQGVGAQGSTAFLKTLYPLSKALWRYQLIQPAALIGVFTQSSVNTSTATITIANHGLLNGASVYLTSSGTVPGGLVANQNYYIVNATTNTFSLALSLGGTGVTLTNSGSGNMSLYVNQPFGPGQWSPWQPMNTISPTAYTFAGPPASSLYTVQINLIGADDSANAFSLYQLSPEVNNATVTALAVRLTALDDPVVGEVVVARGSTASLNDRLSLTINPDGSRISDPELLGAQVSTILPSESSIKNRLDMQEGMSYWLTGDYTNRLKPTNMVNKGIPNQIVSGPVDSNGNALFMQQGSTPNLLNIQGSDQTPLIVTVNGSYYRFARDFSLSFTGYTPGTYYIYAEFREASLTFQTTDVSTVSSTISNASASLLEVGDHVQFTTTGTLPSGLSLATTYYVNFVSSPIFSVSATQGGTSVLLADTGSGSHTITLVDQEMGNTVLTGTTAIQASPGDTQLICNEEVDQLDALMESLGIPLTLWLSSIPVGQSSFISPLLPSAGPDTLLTVGQMPSVIPSGTYFEVRSHTETAFTVYPTRSDSSTKLCLGQATWTGSSFSDIRNYRYLNQYTSDIRGSTQGSNPTPITVDNNTNLNYGPIVFDHNLGEIPGHFRLYLHQSSTGDVSPIVIEGDAIFQSSTTQLQVINRYVSVIGKDFSRSNIQSGYLQLIIA